jgi:hypothetical protein
MMSSLIPIVIEMLYAVRFASQLENDYWNRCSDISKENVWMKPFIYK